jgi:hypothetical protein
VVVKMALMVLRWLVCVGLVSTLCGCFNPRVKDFGFACNVNDVDPCPAGFQCVNGYCDDGSGGRPPGGGSASVDMSLAATMDMAGAVQSIDMAPSNQSLDMAQPPIIDMAQPPGPDMTPPICQPIGGSCTSYKDCCSGHCHSIITPHVCYTG